MQLLKIVSGGQTGADLGGLLAAREMGIETGGFIPKGFLTEIGPEPDLGDQFGLVETESSKYEPRTFMNAKLGDGTIRFATNWQSPGEFCTIKAIHKYNKPFIDVDVKTPIPVEDVVNWIKNNSIRVLNVAGNRESKSPGIEVFVKNYMIEVLKGLQT